MGQHIIKMPDIGEGIAEVELVAWRVKVGDRVEEDQILADVMTDKATVEIPSSVAGTVVALGGAVGQMMAVGSEVIRLEVAGAENHNPTAPAILQEPMRNVPVERIERASEAPTLIAKSTKSKTSGEKPIASPAVRRKAWDLGIELQLVPGSGPAGRITHADLAAYAEQRPQPVAQAGSVDARFALRRDEHAIPVMGLRRKIAQKMQDAKRRIPHFTYVEEVDMTELELLRAQLNTRHGTARPRLTVLPFLIRAMVLAVREHPEINARFDDEANVVTRFGAVHLGIATQTEGGLVVPVLRHAETLDLWVTAAAVLRLCEAARSGKATREELAGSTLTLSSLGALGGIVSTPVINHPEVAIVGVNRIVERPMVKNGAIVVRQMMNLSSSFDHRVVDGLHAAQFIQCIRSYLESPATLFLE